MFGFLFAPKISQMDPEELKRRLRDEAGSVLLVDVREAFEQALSPLSDVLSRPLGAIPARLGELPKDKTLVLLCPIGTRSEKAAKILMKNGFRNVFVLNGGIGALKKLRSEQKEGKNA
jgi:rhodanese-related sulfurtransferase